MKNMDHWKKPNRRSDRPGKGLVKFECYFGCIDYRIPSRAKGRFCTSTCWGKYETGKINPNWSGGETVVGKYQYVLTPNHPNKNKKGYVLKHRLVLEEKLGRYLKKGEVAHHINGDTKDNSPENIGLMNSQADHIIHHMPKVLAGRGIVK